MHNASMSHPDIEDSHKVKCVRLDPGDGFDVEAGKSYFWCSCGRSKKQPLCDGSHEGTDFKPVEYKAETTEKFYFCMCKQTADVRGKCDGSHNKLAADAVGRFVSPRPKISSVEAAPAAATYSQLALGSVCCLQYSHRSVGFTHLTLYFAVLELF